MNDYFLVREVSTKALFLCKGDIPAGYEFVSNVYDKDGKLLPEFQLLRRIH